MGGILSVHSCEHCRKTDFLAVINSAHAEEHLADGGVTGEARREAVKGSARVCEKPAMLSMATHPENFANGTGVMLDPVYPTCTC